MGSKAKKSAIFVFSTAYHPFIGGAEIAIEQISKRLKDEFDFFIVTSRMRRDLPKREARPEGIVIRIGFGNRFDKFLLPIFGIFAFWREDIKNSKIIFWGMDLSFGSVSAAILKILNPKIPFIFTIQYGYGDERVARGRFGFMNLAFRLILREADCVVAISNYLLDLCRQYGYTREGAVIYNGVDFEKFAITSEENKKIPNTVITVGRLVHKNGTDILIKAIAELKKEILGIKLHIVGDGAERKSLEDLSRKLSLGEAIKFFGDIAYDEIPKYLAEADIFARPSRSEGMGNSFVEALASGLPIIGTPVGGILDIIEDEKTGLFAKIDNPKDLAEKIKILFKNKKLAVEIIKNGQEIVKEKFSWNKIADSYKQIFENNQNV